MNLKTWCALVPGRQAELAAHLKVTPSAVSQALSDGKRVPPTWYRGVVEFTNSEVGFDDLVPETKRKRLISTKRRGKAAPKRLMRAHPIPTNRP